LEEVPLFNGKYFDWNQKRVKEIVNHYGHKFMYQKRVLDLGCGYGDIGGVLYRLGSEVVAVDARQDHLKMVSKKFPGIRIVKADLDREWPFRGQVFDLILDMGLLCHLADYEKHLKTVCASTRHLVLETAVCDSDDPNKSLPSPENKGVYDLSINGVGCRPSPAAIERVLRECGMNFKRMDSNKFNSGNIVYDWQAKNDNSTSIDKRRIWFCTKEGHIHVTPPPPTPPPTQPNNTKFVAGNYLRTGTPLSAIQKTASPQPPTNVQVRADTNFAFSRAPSESINMNPTYTGGYSSDNNQVREASQRFSVVYPSANAPPISFGPNNLPLPITSNPPLRVLYLPLNDADNVQQGMYDAWNNVGVELKVFDFYRMWLNTKNKNKIQADFVQTVREFQPQLIHMQLQFTGLIDAATLRAARTACPNVVITNWSGDIRREAIFDFVTLTHETDYLLISSTGQLDMYRRAGCKNVRYWQIGFDPKFSFPMGQTQFEYDGSFIGNAYGGQFPDSELRATVVCNLKGAFGAKFGLFGGGYPYSKQVSPRNTNAIYNNSICPVSISNFNSVSHYFSDRLLGCLASGRPTISWYFPGIESYFAEGKEILVAKSVKDAIDQINWCKNNPEAANQIGAAGYARVLKEHTFTSKILELLTMTNLLPSG
jgi:spore maturation protein CgeB/SAM-dependent methyltransferase